jgi:hypothetical protein
VRLRQHRLPRDDSERPEHRAPHARVDESQLGGFDRFKEIRNALFAKVGIENAPMTAPLPADAFEEFPKPLLKWTEPEDWPAYRTSLVKSESWMRLLMNELWFFARCLGVILLLWLLVSGFQMGGKETIRFLFLAVGGSLFFTWVHWLHVIWPAAAMDITVRETGLTRTPGKQIWDHPWSEFEGWRLIERSFLDRTLRILLLKHERTTIPITFPDATTQDKMIEILRAKNLPESTTVSVPWSEPK